MVKKPLGDFVQVRLFDGMRAEVVELAARDERTLSSWIRKAISDQIRRERAAQQQPLHVVPRQVG